MDECQRFVSAAIERALSEFGKFNTFLFLAHQYVEQIDDGMVKAMLSNTENKVVGRNSAATMSSIASDVGVEKEDLLKINKYQFYLKSGDKDSFLFQSNDYLLDHPHSEFYISEEEAYHQVDKKMIERYYRAINRDESTSVRSGDKTSENSVSVTRGSDVSAILLEDNDF